MIKGQMSIFDILDNDVLFGKNDETTVMKNYLSREDKIITLAKKKKEQERQFKKNSFMEIFNFNVYNKKAEKEKYEYILAHVRNYLIRPLFEQEMDCENAVKLYSSLGLAPENISLVQSGSSPDTILKSFFRKKGNYKGGICLHWEKDVYIPFGEKCRLAKSRHLRSWTLRPEYNYHLCADAGMFLDSVVLFTTLRKTILSLIAGLSEKECIENPIYNYIISAVDKNLSKYEAEDEYMVMEDAYGYQFVREYLKGYKHCHVVSKEEFGTMGFFRKTHVLKLKDFSLLFFIMEDIPDDFVMHLAQYDAFYMAETIPVKHCIHIFELLFEEYMQDKTEHEYENSLKKDYALSFQTKKNISGKILAAMEKSSFNDWFGYVEFDKDIDLSLMDELEKEWKAIASFLKLKETKDVMLRFRKLGQHKASGLFYSLYNCICVDIRNPSSMIHEYMHMLDYNNGKASRKASFSKTSNRYAKILKDKVASSKELKAVLKGKYDLSYYLTATEIFARCGEIYVTRCLGINNSLAEPENTFAYPEDEELIKFIKEYYDSFLDLDSDKICLR